MNTEAINQRIAHEFDTLLFPSEPIAPSHPDNLRTLAHLLGLDAPEPATARILELGCGTGENLMSLATLYPDATLLGVDLSAAQIAYGNAIASRVGLNNVTLRVEDILHLELEPDSHDYILCHGVFSWVPEPVRDRILELTRHALSPTGIAFISFNSLPGWHISGLMRSILFELVDRSLPPQDQVLRAHEVFRWVLAGASIPDNICGPSLSLLAQQLLNSHDGYLFHEYLTPVNDAFYLRDFRARALEHGLGYLGNAVPDSMFPPNFSPEVLVELSHARNATQVQHLLDLAQGKRFQNSLLVHAERSPTLELSPARLEPLHVFAELATDPASHPAEGFPVHTSSGFRAELAGTHLQHALARLNTAAPLTIPFRELAADLDPDRRTHLAHVLLHLYFSLAIGLSLELAPITDDSAVTHPRVSALVRDQAPRQDWVSSLWHRACTVSAAERALLPRLDGSLHRDTLSGPERDMLGRFAREGLLLQR